MQKLQILFPDPLMKRMRGHAKRIDLPVSEIVRRATERWLDQFPDAPPSSLALPAVDAGRCLVAAEEMRDAIYE